MLEKEKLNRSEVDVHFYVLVYFLFQLYETRTEFHLKKILYAILLGGRRDNPLLGGISWKIALRDFIKIWNR